jgi:RNA-directed DNA polymerase
MIHYLKTITDLAEFLSVDISTLTKIDPESSYHTFQIPKPGSSEKRTIETPVGTLRYVLDRIADSLQWLYLDYITDAAYGYVRAVKNRRIVRNIYTNAKRHLGRKYLLNIDLDNFFHQIDTRKVSEIFNDGKVFSFDDEAVKFITHLITFHNRMPMGSPVSPPISNFATISMDRELISWATRSNFRYTRYVDDLSFSSNMQISKTHFEQINEIILTHKFIIDSNKTHWFGKHEPKEITGLIVGDSISIPDQFINDFEIGIKNLREMKQLVNQYPDPYVFEWIDKLYQVMNGRLAFLQMIYGKTHSVYQALETKVRDAEHIDECAYSLSWRYAGYDYH